MNDIKVSTTRPVRVSRAVWYTTPEGKELLRNLFNRLKTDFADLAMQRNGSEEIMLVFKSYRKQVILTIPNDFPQAAFACQIDGQTATVANYCDELDPISNMNTLVREIRAKTQHVSLPAPLDPKPVNYTNTSQARSRPTCRLPSRLNPTYR